MLPGQWSQSGRGRWAMNRSGALDTDSQPAKIQQIDGVQSFYIRNGHSWGEVHIRPFDGGVSVTANSDFGHFAYVWTAIGERTWQNFLTKTDFGYFMGKAAANHGRVFDCAATIEGIKKDIDQRQGDGWFSIRRAQDLKDSITSDFASSEPAWMMEAWHSDWIGELYETDISALEIEHCRCPQAVGFWEEIWRPLCEQLETSLAVNSAQRS